MLAQQALDDTIASGFTIVPVCPYINRWIQRPPDYQQHAGQIGPDHLAAARRTASL